LRKLTTSDNAFGRPLFQSKPHMTWDNYFSGSTILEYAAEQGFGMTCTVRRDRLPKGVPPKYWHKEKTQPNAQRPKAARFHNPILVMKEQVQSLVTLTSFQSTSSCNIASVNGINGCSLYAQTKEQGQSRIGKKRQWAIEMNESRELYLNTYGKIDRMDHPMQNCRMTYW
jgi:hypothetical protein